MESSSVISVPGTLNDAHVDGRAPSMWEYEWLDACSCESIIIIVRQR